MARKTIGVAVWEYLDRSRPPKRRLAYFGDEVDLSASETKRAEAAGVFDELLVVDPQVGTGLDAGTVVGDVDLTKDDNGSGDGGADDQDDLADLAGDGTDTDGDSSAADDSGADADQPVPEKGTMAKPSNTADLALWVAYAVDQGLDEDEATAMGRAALIKALA